LKSDKNNFTLRPTGTYLRITSLDRINVWRSKRSSFIKLCRLYTTNKYWL